MSKLFIEDSTLSAIGDAIRSKAGTTSLIAPGNMPGMILNLETEAPTPTVTYPNMYYIHETNGTNIQEEVIIFDTTNLNNLSFIYAFDNGSFSNFQNSRVTIQVQKGYALDSRYETSNVPTYWKVKEVDSNANKETIASLLTADTSQRYTIDVSAYTSVVILIQFRGASDSGTNRGSLSITNIQAS